MRMVCSDPHGVELVGVVLFGPTFRPLVKILWMFAIRAVFLHFSLNFWEIQTGGGPRHPTLKTGLSHSRTKSDKNRPIGRKPTGQLMDAIFSFTTSYSSSLRLQFPVTGDRLFLAVQTLSNFVEWLALSQRLPPLAAVFTSVRASFL